MTIFEFSELTRADVEQYTITDECKQTPEKISITLDYITRGPELYFYSIILGKYLNAEIVSIQVKDNTVIVDAINHPRKSS